RIEGLENLTEALSRGGGAVMASMHFGAWETGLAMWNDRGHPMALLAEELRPRALFDRVAGARGHLGVRVIPLDVTAIRGGEADAARRAAMTAMREVFRLLRSGVPVALALDRDLVGGGTPLPFFGREARIPLGVVEVAIRSGAAIIPTALLPTATGVEARLYPEVGYDAGAPRDAEVTRVTRVVLALWEGIIRDHPHLWHVLDPIWDQPAGPRPGA
ncbi:MAG: lysophospholipid acyltransferase family protein, partial [Candidatus Dormibacteria bacterium]